MQMQELKTHLDQAFQWLSRVSVSGESVDCLAMARQELRKAYQEIKDCEEPEEDTNGGQTN